MKIMLWPCLSGLLLLTGCAASRGSANENTKSNSVSLAQPRRVSEMINATSISDCSSCDHLFLDSVECHPRFIRVVLLFTGQNDKYWNDRKNHVVESIWFASSKSLGMSLISEVGERRPADRVPLNSDSPIVGNFRPWTVSGVSGNRAWSTIELRFCPEQDLRPYRLVASREDMCNLMNCVQQKIVVFANGSELVISNSVQGEED